LHDAMPDSRELERFQRSPGAKSSSRRQNERTGIRLAGAPPLQR
jgi:hypothetical protein